jgi:hypothetical protein
MCSFLQCLGREWVGDEIFKSSDQDFYAFLPVVFSQLFEGTIEGCGSLN